MHFSCLTTVTGLSDLCHTSILIGTQVILLSYNIFISIASVIVYLTSVSQKRRLKHLLCMSNMNHYRDLG